MNHYELNSVFLAILEWGYVAVAAGIILFTLWSVKKYPELKTILLWLVIHLFLMIGAHLLFWMGLGNQSDGLTPIDNAVDQIHFLMGVAGLLWLMGMLCLVLCIQLLKDRFSAKLKKSGEG
ncbi:hypothetical protein P6709_16970 [Jeotgalibacillus sp. ET6]|uniref:hypothetical protein n=1 Tax=Jeotgalibacillus sp. ET6 TaxID=3037260 RepID=UPI00241890C5|nr:hypothetical protein [Jeotgalibacillus sp. ET6]MDG5473432.1 hypothetical protein [Jeotgalibacillus sp. ET6]